MRIRNSITVVFVFVTIFALGIVTDHLFTYVDPHMCFTVHFGVFNQVTHFINNHGDYEYSVRINWKDGRRVINYLNK